MFSIGDLSRRTGVKVPTIRYYEQMGLVAAPERSEGNQRRYSRQELERLAFIRHARDLGFAVEDIRALIDLSVHPEQPCSHADQIAQEQLISVREKIAQLKRLETELERIASCCDGKMVGDCYVIRALSDHALCADEHVR
ncbi:MerR family transcriptional regulator [Mesorhizobium erdmanii]|uniref:MerR family transcriptional regulator n=2 Tax=Mesorhizobium TaxID=68287 RepID=A0A3M9XFT3_9HYPH|nr:MULTISPECIES: helix-turn-helix domain-containing protein [Mesorhizobium]RNJ46883.1 MerR family transcriptional regulator [Mesorhizobium japonicum]RXT34113.1 MerR family transcriptional regulator [Mesorhizobium erdmanii]